MSTDRKIRVGCIGVGQIGKMHVRNYAGIPAAELVAIADIDETEARRVASQFGVAHVYADFRDLLARDDIEAVDVCLHNNLHMPVTLAALAAGKHVYCEKPIAGAYCDGLAMAEAARRAGLQLAVQLGSLYRKETRAARYLIDQGVLGPIYHARSTGHRRRGRPYVDGYGTANFVQKKMAGGGAIFDMGVYHIAEMLYLMDNPKVLRVSGKTYQRTELDDERRRTSRYDVEELGMGLVRFENDVTLDIIESWAIHLDAFAGSYVVGEKAGMRLAPFGLFYNVGDVSVNAAPEPDSFHRRRQLVRGDADAYDSPQQHWIAARQGRVPLLPTAELALNTMLISEGIYLSNTLNREVTAEEIAESSVSTALKLEQPAVAAV
ncbi:MAG: Gfo/Idh/MocA family oxidoreductase [Kiritimatiellae bacterium]|nr:Gfo/Idh/MocA family oxidoreductase [Kiritimatiellia bacterium]